MALLEWKALAAILDVLLINKQGDTSVYSRHLPSDPKESMMRLK